MSEVVIAGIGQTDVGEHYTIALRDLALMALEAAIRDAGGLRPDILFVGKVLVVPVNIATPTPTSRVPSATPAPTSTATPTRLP